MILYIHGFGSSGNSSKGIALRSYFPDENVVTPDLPKEPRKAIAELEKIITDANEPTLLVGSSQGGFFSNYLMRKHDTPALLINPGNKLWDDLPNLDSKYPEKYKKQLKKIYKNIKNTDVSKSLINVVFANDDEIVDHTESKKKFKGANTFLTFDNAGHIFTRFDELLPLIKKLHDEVKILDERSFGIHFDFEINEINE